MSTVVISVTEMYSRISETTEGKALTLVALISVSYCLPFSLLGHSNTLI